MLLIQLQLLLSFFPNYYFCGLNLGILLLLRLLLLPLKRLFLQSIFCFFLDCYHSCSNFLKYIFFIPVLFYYDLPYFSYCCCIYYNFPILFMYINECLWLYFFWISYFFIFPLYFYCSWCCCLGSSIFLIYFSYFLLFFNIL